MLLKKYTWLILIDIGCKFAHCKHLFFRFRIGSETTKHLLFFLKFRHLPAFWNFFQTAMLSLETKLSSNILTVVPFIFEPGLYCFLNTASTISIFPFICKWSKKGKAKFIQSKDFFKLLGQNFYYLIKEQRQYRQLQIHYLFYKFLVLALDKYVSFVHTDLSRKHIAKTSLPIFQKTNLSKTIRQTSSFHGKMVQKMFSALIIITLAMCFTATDGQLVAYFVNSINSIKQLGKHNEYYHF